MSAPVTESKNQIKHSLSIRLWHWVNATVMIVMIMSGLMILNAHPHLYWGQEGYAPVAAWISVPEFPGWMTIPSTYSLALGRRVHLAFAWAFAFGLLFYFVRAGMTGSLRRAIGLSRAEVSPTVLKADISKHLRRDFSAHGGGYNPLQKISYALVLCIFLPGLIFSGLTLSPGMNAAWPWLLDIFGGRQSARSIHFICMAGVSVFIIVHIIMVLVAGPIKLMRGMITGRETSTKEEPQL